MRLVAWPDVRSSCPVCGRSGCATFRGYYSRFLFCTELEVFGRVVIRTGYCRSQKKRFSLLPDFMIKRRRISVFSLERLREAHREHRKVAAAIDEINGDLGEEFFVPISTAHAYLKFSHERPP